MHFDPFRINALSQKGIIFSSQKSHRMQQGLEIRGFWVQKKTVQLKTALRKVYNYVLNGIFFQKTV